jgi:hypothetical protein
MDIPIFTVVKLKLGQLCDFLRYMEAESELSHSLTCVPLIMLPVNK